MRPWDPDDESGECPTGGSPANAFNLDFGGPGRLTFEGNEQLPNVHHRPREMIWLGLGVLHRRLRFRRGKDGLTVERIQ